MRWCARLEENRQKGAQRLWWEVEVEVRVWKVESWLFGTEALWMNEM